MARPQDIQDLLDHIALSSGVHGITSTPTSGGVVKADSSGHIADGWLADNIVRTVGGYIPDSKLSSNVVRLSGGLIPNSLLSSVISGKTFRSSGSFFRWGFEIADGTDLSSLVSTMISTTGLRSIQNASTGTSLPIYDAALTNYSNGVLTLHRWYKDYYISDCNYDCDCSN